MKFVIALLLSSAWASTTDPNQLLRAVRANVQLALHQLPRYLCTEVVQRSELRIPHWKSNKGCNNLNEDNPPGKLLVSDRLRLDVSVAGNGEMYSWAGENRFQDGTLSDLVQSGATSTGEFSSLLGAVFDSEGVTIRYAGTTVLDGRSLARFEFQVPRKYSRYTVRDDEHKAVVAFHGTFLVDASNAQLINLSVTPEDVPAVMAVCQTKVALDYGTLHANGAEFILPHRAQFRAIRTNGTESYNETTFSACHQFTGESTLRFDDPTQAAGASSAPRNPDESMVPAGRGIIVSLAQTIDIRTAATGDLVTFRLDRSLRGRNRRIIAPAGSQVRGRIVLMEMNYGSDYNTLTIAIQLESINVNGEPLPLRARLEQAYNGRSNWNASGPVDYNQIAAKFGVLQFDHISPNFAIPRGTQISGVTE